MGDEEEILPQTILRRMNRTLCNGEIVCHLMLVNDATQSPAEKQVHVTAPGSNCTYI